MLRWCSSPTQAIKKPSKSWEKSRIKGLNMIDISDILLRNPPVECLPYIRQEWEADTLLSPD